MDDCYMMYIATVIIIIIIYFFFQRYPVFQILFTWNIVHKCYIWNNYSTKVIIDYYITCSLNIVLVVQSFLFDNTSKNCYTKIHYLSIKKIKNKKIFFKKKNPKIVHIIRKISNEMTFHSDVTFYMDKVCLIFSLKRSPSSEHWS